MSINNEYKYNKLNDFLQEKFGEKTLKICIDGGFTCPNRDGSKGYNGCIFCSERGSGEHLEPINITTQVTNFLNSYKSKRANKFIAYFQNFTNTYDSIENLKIKYDAALIDNRIVGLAIATRPDCINENVAKLLQTYSDKYYVWVELGLQTANDKTGKILNRCYTTENFSNAVSILKSHNIDVVTHIMVGLPNETTKDLEKTITFINSQPITGLKIHSTYIVKNTKLEKMYKNNEYTPITFNYYMDCVTYIITHLRPNIVIHRISGDSMKDLLVAPDWNLHKKWVMNELFKRMNNENLYQGMYYNK